MENVDTLYIKNLKMEKDAAVRLKDDLVAQLRVMKKKLQEAEEEQYKAEEDAAALHAELGALQHREENRNVIVSTLTSDQYHFLQEEVATLKVELQNALRQLQQEQEKARKEHEHVVILRAEQGQLKSALIEAQTKREENATSITNCSTEDAFKGVQHYQLRELASMVERLEKGRQKLLTEIDAQSVEIERLFVENDSLATCLKEASTFTEQWELKVRECLQENASLRAELNDARTKLAQRTGDVSNDENESSKLQMELVKAKGQAEASSAQVLHLAAELNHAKQRIGSLNWLYKPVLANIEHRLLQLKQHGSDNEVTLAA